MEYLLKASAVIVLFYSCYYLFLRSDTFFESNRWFLLLGLITAFCIPNVVIPIYIEKIATPMQYYNFVESGNIIPAERTFDLLQMLWYIYIIGVIFFFIKFSIQVYSLALILIKNPKQKHKRYTFVETQTTFAPFSFFNWIVYNPNQFDSNELNQIIEHEKVHVKQLHSVDILISQLTSIILWFNPFIWLYRKNLQQNLEFIADYTTQQKIDCKKSYQHLLVKTSVPNYKLALTNNFYNSLIKKRIIMLHKNRSKNSNHWKFALILPLLTLFLMSFNTKEIVTYKNASIPELDILQDTSVSNDQIKNLNQGLSNSNKSEKSNLNTSNSSSKVNSLISKKLNAEEKGGDIEMVLITKDFTDADFEKIQKQFAEKGITVKFKGIKRNSGGEITAIKIDVSSKSSNANYNTNSDEPISPIKVTFDTDGKSISIGNSSELHFGKGYSFVSKDGKHKVHSTDKGSNVFVFSSDDDEHEDGEVHEDHDEHEGENIFVFKKDGKTHEVKRIHKDKKVHVISGDDHEIIDIDTDNDDKIIIKNGKVIKTKKDKDENLIWEEKGGDSFEVKTLGKGNTFFISGDGKNDPLFILDGKEITKKEMEAIEPDNIEKIEVLKGDAATKKYGDKGEHGVVLITLKTKE